MRILEDGNLLGRLGALAAIAALALLLVRVGGPGMCPVASSGHCCFGAGKAPAAGTPSAQKPH